MADYKDYIVRYDIQADVTKAAGGLRSIAEIAKQFEKPMNDLRTAIRDVSNDAFKLKQNSQIKFAPTIDVATFNKQLRNMVVQVRNAAAEMHAALYGALSGNAPATKAMQQGMANGLKNEIKSAQQLKNELLSLEKERDKLLGTPKRDKKGKVTRANDGNIFYTKNGLKQDPGNTALQERLLNYQSQEKYLRERINAVKKAISAQEKIEKEAAAQEKKAASKAGTAVKSTAKPSTAQPAKLTNVTPAVIREWKNVFGDKTLKNLTVNIRGNASGANGALTVIEQVQTALKTLQGQSSFNINPVLNAEAFAVAEARLRQLAALSTAVTAPFITQNNKTDGKAGSTTPLTKDEKSKLAAARKQIKALTEKITPLQSRLETNQAKYAETPTPGLKGQITRDTKSIASLQASKAEQENIVKGIQNRIPAAVQSKAKGIKPFAVDIIGNLTAINTPKSPFTVPLIGELAKLQGKITEAIPVNIKIFPDQVAASIKALPPQTMNVGVHLVADNIPQQLKTISEQTKPVAKQQAKTQATAAASTRPVYPETTTGKAKKATGSQVAISGHVDTKDIISQIKSIPRQAIPLYVKLMWDKGVVGRQAQLKELGGKIPPIALKLDTTAAIAKLEEFIAQVKASSPQNIKLTATGTTPATNQSSVANTSVKPPVNILGSGVNTQNNENKSGGSTRQPLTAHNRYERNKSKAQEKYYRQRQDNRHIASKHQEYATQQANWYAQQQAMYNHLFRDMPRAPKPDFGWAERQELRRAAELSAMREDARSAFARMTPFEQKERASAVSSSISHHARQAETLRNQARNAILPFVKSESQANTVLKNRRFFRDAVTLTGINPAAANVTSPQMLQYYRGVADWMQVNKVAVPWQLQDQINKLSTQISQNTDAQRTIQRKASVDQSIARHQQRANRLKAQAQNAMLPFAQNKEQLNMLTKHRKFFRQAVAATGIIPTPGMEAPQMLRYLQGVSSQMQSASVAVPWQLQSQINKLEGQIAKSNGIGNSSSTRGASAAPMPVNKEQYFDRARRLAYPLTGQTSFGARTPMAVDMAKGMGVMFAISGAMSAVGSSFSQAVEYQNIMKTTQAILQHGTDTYSQDSFKNMEETVRNVGVKTKFSAPEVANAARFLAMAGYDINAINASIRPIADLALIGDSDLGETADKMTNIMTTFQIAPERMREAANIMATTATRSNTDLMMLAESAKYGGGVANMYGRNDPHLFADTMALFGVMGNAGIQGSSAGTALRMMYQNIFKPNKTQKKVLDMIEENYGIKTIKDNGDYRAMSEILIDIAQRVPENQMAQIVGNLFRITAQPGASAALLAAAGGDKNMALEISAGIDAISNKMSSKEGLSSLLSLMLANRESVNSNISGSIAEDKQNTPKGLWAQVTSTFTEGVLRAFEQRQGGFEEMLRKLRDYLAKPETVQMMQNLLDMIVEIGKVMAWFVKIWANLYNLAPGLIKGWVVTQMFFTQIGTLIGPVISLIGAFNWLGNVIARLVEISAIGAGVSVTSNMAGNVMAGAVANTVPFVPMPGASNKFASKIGSKVNSAMAANAVRVGKMPLSDKLKSNTLESINQETAQHYRAVQERYYRRYGWARAGAAFRSAFTAVPTLASFAPVIGGIKSMFMGLLTTLAKGIGFIINPITLATSAVVGLGFVLHKLKQFTDGNTEAQILAQQQMAKLSSEAVQTMVDNYKWYQEQIDKYKNPAQPLDSVGTSDKQREYEARAENFRSEYADIIKGDLSKNASEKGILQQVQEFRDRVNKNDLYKYAFGDEYDKYVGAGLTEDNSSLKYTGTQSDEGAALYNLFFATKRHAKEVQNREIQAALRTAGVNRPEIQSAHEAIVRLRQLYLGGQLTQDEYFKQAYAERDKVVNLNNPSLRSSEGLTLEAFQNISDPSVYREYALGQYNVLNSFISGEDGTIVAKLNAQKALRDKLVVSGKKYWQAISNVIGDYPIQFKAVSMDEKIVKDITLHLSMIPNTDKIDFNAVADKIQSAVGDFKRNIEDFANMAAKVYKDMANAGLVPNTEEGMNSFVWQQMEHAHISKEQATSYFHNHVPENSVWKRAGKTLEEWQQYIADPNGEVTINGKKYRSVIDRMAIRKKLTENAVSTIMGTVDKLKANKPQTTSTTSTTTSTTPTATNDQTAYNSHYEKAASRPTHISIHINELAHFDRTTVASSAEERDLIAMMESRITDALYQVFAQAANQAQNVIDLT